jgi:hypothetical protein
MLQSLQQELTDKQQRAEPAGDDDEEEEQFAKELVPEPIKEDFTFPPPAMPPSTTAPPQVSRVRSLLETVKPRLGRYAVFALVLFGLIHFALPMLSRSSPFGLEGQLTLTGLGVAVAGAVVSLGVAETTLAGCCFADAQVQKS